MLAGTVKGLKAEVKRQLKVVRQRYARTFHPFTADDLIASLRNMGVHAGDTLLVHSSFDAFIGFAGKPTDVITALQTLLGPSGALMMPTMPFTGTAVAWAAENRVFDVVRTPSRMGLLTELFRRSPGVVRSTHPTHPVAVWGHDANAIIAGHDKARTPCGADSPFAHLFDRNGRILLLGADISSLTFYHWIEEQIEPLLPESPFTKENFTMTSRGRDGREVTTVTRLFEPPVSRRRNLFRLVPALKERRAWCEKRLGRVNMILLNAKDVHAVAVDLAKQGIYCYD